MKKILLIHPNFPESYWTFKDSCELSGRLAILPPISLATIAALTPAHYEVKIVDECIEEIDFEQPCDLVGITGYNVHQPRMVEIAKEFRKRGKLVVAGGPFCSSNPDIAVDSFDVVVVGEAERVWPKFLEDWEQNNHHDFYEEKEKLDLQKQQSPIPRYDLVPAEQYLGGMVQTSRGCPYDCEYCDVISLFGRKMRHKPVEQVIEEIKIVSDQGAPQIFIADDNLIGNKIYAKKLLKALIQFNKTRKKPLSFLTQLTLNCAEDDELLDLIQQANFLYLFIGIETPKRESLIIANKRHNMRSDMKESIRKIQSRGIVVLSGMMVGFDTDDLSIFETQETFLKEAGLMFPMLNVLVALRGTKLWKRLENENRLLDISKDQSITTNIIPKRMTNEEIDNNYRKLIKTVYSEDHFRASFQAYLDQINVEEMKKGPSNQMSLSTITFLEVKTVFRLLWSLLTSGQAKRKLLFDVLIMSIKKDISCVPAGLLTLFLFYGVNGFVNRAYPAKDTKKAKAVNIRAA